MGSLEEIYWNMAKKQWKVGTHYAIMPSCDGNYLINNTLYMSASSLCSHKCPHALISYSCALIYILLFVRKINYL